MKSTSIQFKLISRQKQIHLFNFSPLFLERTEGGKQNLVGSISVPLGVIPHRRNVFGTSERLCSSTLLLEEEHPL